MRQILFATAAAAVIGAAAATPVGAQVYLGADPGGVGVQVGPFGVGVGPDYWDHHHRYYRDYAYARPECRTFRERIVTPSGDVIWQTHRTCD